MTCRYHQIEVVSPGGNWQSDLKITMIHMLASLLLAARQPLSPSRANSNPSRAVIKWVAKTSPSAIVRGTGTLQSSTNSQLIRAIFNPDRIISTSTLSIRKFHRSSTTIRQVAITTRRSISRQVCCQMIKWSTIQTKITSYHLATWTHNRATNFQLQWLPPPQTVPHLPASAKVSAVAKMHRPRTCCKASRRATRLHKLEIR